MKRDTLVRIAIASGVAAWLAGCGTTVPLNVLAPGVGGAVTASYAAASQPQGPRVTFVNDSTMPLVVRYWVGWRDTSVAGGVADIRTDDHMSFTAQPGEFFTTQVGRAWKPTSMADAIVRVRIDTPATGGTAHEPIWIQLEQPQPYTLQAVGGSRDTLVLNRYGGGAITPLERGLWIDDNFGPFPVVVSSSAR